MLAFRISKDMATRLSSYDESWESDLLSRLLFPLAYALLRIRHEEVPWDVLLKDALHTLLKYLALLGTSEYLLSARALDYDINDELKHTWAAR